MSVPTTGGVKACVCPLLVEWRHECAPLLWIGGESLPLLVEWRLECAHYWRIGGVSVPTTSGVAA
jgi:hypothetical protein